MVRQWLQAGVLTAGVLLVGSAAAQEVVHAVSGTMVKTDPKVQTIQISTNDGSEGTFSLRSSKTTDVDFDRYVRSEATPAASFNKPSGDTVVVFYYGNDLTRTAVAVQDLGSGPFDTVDGTVTKYDKHQHMITVKPTSGAAKAFHLDPKAVADTTNGAVPGDKFEPSKGDTVRVIAAKGNGTETAMFVRD